MVLIVHRWAGTVHFQNGLFDELVLFVVVFICIGPKILREPLSSERQVKLTSKANIL